MTNERKNTIDRILSIIYDYGMGGNYWKEFNVDEIQEIANRITTEVVGLEDDDEYAGLVDLTKK